MKKYTILAISCFTIYAQNSTDLFSDLTFRNIGPSVAGGRIHDVEVMPGNPEMLFIASASGGIWKSINKGTTWKPVFDNEVISTFGDIAISKSNTNILYVGTGEQQNRQSSSWGNGVYKSTDQGETWSSIGLEQTYHISKVLIHPKNPNIVYAGALGNLWKGSEERGVYKTTNGGKTWKKILFLDDKTGIVDMVMDVNNPEIVYAATYQRMRKVWGFNGGGAGSGIYKTTNGGTNWSKLSQGLPSGDLGRIGLAASQNRSNILYATIEHSKESGFYRSANGGRSWKKINTLNPRPMYYSHIATDPKDDKVIYMLAVELYRSEDSGKTFYQLPTRPTYDVGVHSDHHSIFIDKSNSNHFFLAGDAGLHESWDYGKTYSRLNNIPIGQFYAMGVDMEVPYNVYGGMQDNHSWMGPSATRHWLGILADNWKQVGFGDGMAQQPDPESDIVYNASQNGNIIRFDKRNGNMQGLRPIPAKGEEKYRFDWVTPIVLSQYSNKKVYLGGNRLFITRDGGISWQRTEDLTKNINRDSLQIMGVLGADITLSKNDGTSTFGEIISISESPIRKREVWVGTDDGNVQVTKDDGISWTEVSQNILGLPKNSYVSRVMASRKGRGHAYVTFDRHREGDWTPYVYKTEDYGQSWTAKNLGLPSGSINVIIEHPDNPDLLFIGTEHSIFMSMDSGSEWIKVTSNLPTTLYDDMLIHPRDKDLVIGTHGRSFWILDDIAPLAEWTKSNNKYLHIFSMRDATLFYYWKSTSYRSQEEWVGPNPEYGALINYVINTDADSVTISIKQRNREIRKFKDRVEKGKLKRLVWDLKYDPPTYANNANDKEGLIIPKPEEILPKPAHPLKMQGVDVSPGTFDITISTDDHSTTKKLVVKADPLVDISSGQYRLRETFLLKVHSLYEDAFALNQTLKELIKRSKDEVPEDDEEFVILKAKQKKVNTIQSGSIRLAGQLQGGGVRQGSFFPPTDTHYQRFDQLLSDWNEVEKK